MGTTVLPSGRMSPLSTTISNVFSAVRASPLAKLAIISSMPSASSTRLPPKPRGSVSARRSSSVSSPAERPCSTNTLHRDKSAELISNEGFSVVAPMRMMLPFSTKGRNASCCALLKRWISSTNRMVCSPKRRFASAVCITSLISLIPLVTALKSMKFAFVLLAMMRASVVLPTPGGPQNTMEGTRSPSMSCRSTLPSPRRCLWPANSSRVRGRILLASGRPVSVFPNNVCCIIRRASPLFPVFCRPRRRPVCVHFIISVTEALCPYPPGARR